MRFLRFAHHDLFAHLESEEHALAPLLAQVHPPLTAEISRMADEHARLRSAIAGLEQAFSRPGDERAHVRIDAARHVATLLTEHIRWEERELFETAQQRLDATQLAALELDLRR